MNKFQKDVKSIRLRSVTIPCNRVELFQKDVKSIRLRAWLVSLGI